MSLHQLIESHWQHPNPVLRALLSPFSRVFAQLIAVRRRCYLSGSLKTQKLPIPVVVVGNLHAGGTGKTPITAALVAALQQCGIHVGIISRGYGRKSKKIHVLHSNSCATDAGDEPLMLFRQTHAPIAVGADRYAAGRALIAQHNDLQIIICDDGLQHYALARDAEICIFPAADIIRNDLDILPNGGLREPISRLQDIDFLVISNADAAAIEHTKTLFRQPEKLFASHIQSLPPYRFTKPSETLSSGSLKTSETCAAIAAIARPHRFFDSLEKQGFTLAETRILPDHALLNLATLPHADYVFITEKDAAKLPPNAPENLWVLPIRANITPDLATAVLVKLGIQAV